MRGVVLILTVAVALVVGFAAPSEAAVSGKKAIWGPVERDGHSLFPTYRRLGAGIYLAGVSWADVAPTRPVTASDPSDPAYRWPPELDVAVREARRHGMRIGLQLMTAPAWAAGGRDGGFAPSDPGDYGAFVRAAARRYPAVDLWIIWGEPTKKKNFRLPDDDQSDERYRERAPGLYARVLRAAYRELKADSHSNLVVGANTYTVGDIRTADFLRDMELPSGRRPRMDLYGHNPFTLRRPDLRKGTTGGGVIDFSDLDYLAETIDFYGLRDGRGRRLRMFLAEFTFPTDHPNHEFNFWVTRKVQAAWLTRALRIVRRWRRIYTLGWHSLYDDPPRPEGDEVNRGLLDYKGRPKPAYYAFMRG